MGDGAREELGQPAPDATAADPFIAVGWELLADVPTGCRELGAVTARVVATNARGETFVDLFPCKAGAGITDPLPIGRYAVRVELLDVGGALLAASAAHAVDLNIPGALVPMDFHFPVDGGYFVATWTMVDPFGRPFLACAEVGAARVSLVATRSGTDEGFEYFFPCDSGVGFTGKLPIGDYSVVVSLLDPADRVIAASAPLDARIVWGNQLEDLGNFSFGI